MHLSRSSGFALFLVVAGVAYLGYRYQMPILIWVAIILGGVIVATTSPEPIIQGRSIGSDVGHPLRQYSGLSTRLIVLLYVALVLGVIALVLFEIAAPMEFYRLWGKWLGQLPW
jgi:hypothetical protein